jgi:hypothetical protein
MMVTSIMRKTLSITSFFLVLSCIAFAQSQPPGPTTTSQVILPLLSPPTGGGASLALVGNPGPQTIFYWIVFNFPIGSTAPVGPFVLSGAPNTLSGSNFVNVFPKYAGATNVDVLKTLNNAPPSGACNCAVATAQTAGTIADQSNSTSSYTVNPLNVSSLNLSLQNEEVSAGASHLILRQAGTFVADLSVAGSGTGTITAVNPSTGIIGGGVSGAVSVGLASSYQLPQTCAAGQVPLWNGTVWSGCSSPTAANVVRVCASGCDATTIFAALSLAQCSSGNCDIIPSANTTYTHNLTISQPNIQIDCPSSSTIITTASATNDVIDLVTGHDYFKIQNCTLWGVANSGDGSGGETTSQIGIYVQSSNTFSHDLIDNVTFGGADSQHGFNFPIRVGNNTSPLQSQGVVIRNSHFSNYVGYLFTGYNLIAANGTWIVGNDSLMTQNPACAAVLNSSTQVCGRHHWYVSTSSNNVIAFNTSTGGLNIQYEANTSDNQPSSVGNLWLGNKCLNQVGQSGSALFGCFHSTSNVRQSKWVENIADHPAGYGFWSENAQPGNPTAQLLATTNGCARSGNTLTIVLQTPISPAPVQWNRVQISGDSSNTVCNGIFTVATVTDGGHFTLTTAPNLVGTSTGTDAGTAQLTYSRGNDNQLLGNSIIQAGLDGILLYGSTQNQLVGNYCFDASQSLYGTYSCFHIAQNGSGIGAIANKLMGGNRGYGANHMAYSLTIDDATDTNNTIEGGDFGLAISGSINDTNHVGLYGVNIVNGAVWLGQGPIPGTSAVVGLNSLGSLVSGTAANVVSLFTGCSGTNYLGADGACHSATGGGTVTSTGPPVAFQFPYFTTPTNIAGVTLGLGYVPAGNANASAPTPIINPLMAPSYTAGADVAVDIQHMIQQNTNGVNGDEVDARGFLATNNVVAHSMLPQISNGTSGYQLWLPAGKITTSVPQKMENSSSIVWGVGRGATSGLGGSNTSASASFPIGLGSSGSVTCTAVSGGACTGYTVVGGSGYYFNPVVTFSGGGCSTEPARSLLVADGVITGVGNPVLGASSNGVGCTTPPVATIHSYPVTPTNGIYTYNMLTGVAGVFSPFVWSVADTAAGYLEDAQIWNHSLDCGTSGTPGAPSSSDYTTGLAIFGTQEESHFQSLKETNCGIAAIDVGGRSNMAVNLGPIVNNEVLWPQGSQCPNPGTTYQGTPFTTAGNVPTSISSNAGGLVTVTLTSNVSQITTGQSITIANIANGPNGEIYSTAANGSGVPIANAGAYYEIVSQTCTNCNTLQYQIQGTGLSNTTSVGLGTAVITPWPVGIRYNTAMGAGIWHSTTTSNVCTPTFFPVETEIAGLGGLDIGNHNEGATVGKAFGDVAASQGHTVISEDNVTGITTGFLISNQFAVQSLWLQNVGTLGGNGGATNVLIDLLSGNTLTTAQQSWLTLYVHDNSGTAGGVFSLVDPSTANSNVYKNGVNIFNGVQGFYSGSTTPTISFTASSGMGLFSNIGLTSSSAHSIPIAEGSSAFNFLGCGSVNGNYIVSFNIVASAAVDPTCGLAGVTVNIKSAASYSLVYSDRGTALIARGGTSFLANLAQITGNTAASMPFVLINQNTDVATETANAADTINGGSNLGNSAFVPVNDLAFNYQDQSTAPGNTEAYNIPTEARLQTLQSCAVLDNAICSGATQSSGVVGVPAILSASVTSTVATITINGATTAMIAFIGGAYQNINSNLIGTYTTSATPTEAFIFLKQDTTHAHPVSGMAISGFTGTTAPIVFATTLTPKVLVGDNVILTQFTAPNTGLNGQVVQVTAVSGAGFTASPTGSGLSTGTGGAIVDVEATTCVPVISYAAPADCGTESTQNPQYWFQLSSNSWYRCTSTCGTPSNFTSNPQPAILVGTNASVTGSGLGTVTMPFRMNPQDVYRRFGDAGSLNQGNGFTINVLSFVDGATHTVDGQLNVAQCFLAKTSTVLQHTQFSASVDSPGILIKSQTPCMVLNNATVNVNGLGRAGSTGIAGVCAAAPAANGFGGSGGGSGGASITNAGCVGGGHTMWFASSFSSSGGTAGTIAGAGGVGSAANGSLTAGYGVPSLQDLSMWAGGSGAGGGTGAGVAAGGVGGTGGSGGGVAIFMAPSFTMAASASISCNGTAGGNGTTVTSGGGGGGGGGGGSCGYIAGFSTAGTTGITASGGGAGTAGTSGGAGAAGGAGNVVAISIQ